MIVVRIFLINKKEKRDNILATLVTLTFDYEGTSFEIEAYNYEGGNINEK